jgi:hypothetical protein
MHQCLRCNQPHNETSLFCARCQEALLNRYQEKEQMVNSAPSLMCEEGAYIREPKLLKLPIRPLDAPQERKLLDESEPLPTYMEIKTPQPRHNPVMFRRLRTAFIVLVILALVALAVDSVLALVVITHKSAGSHRANTPHALSSVPPVIPMQVTPLQTSTNDQIGDATKTNVPGAASKSSTPSNALTGQLAPSQGGGGAALAVSSTVLSFSLTQGQGNPPGQIVTIVNTGVSTLNWATTPSAPSWLVLSSAKGSVAAGQSGQIKVNIVSASLNPGTYNAQMTIAATYGSDMNAQGSPQTVSISLTIFQPCSLQVSPTSMAYTGTTLQLSADTQTISLKVVGDCAQPVTWVANVDSASQKWLNLSSTTGSDSGSGSSIIVSVDAKGMLPGSYQGHISFSVTAGGGTTVKSNTQLITVTLEVRLAGIV